MKDNERKRRGEWLKSHLHRNQPIRVARADAHRVGVRVEPSRLGRVAADVRGVPRHAPPLTAEEVPKTKQIQKDCHVSTREVFLSSTTTLVAH